MLELTLNRFPTVDKATLGIMYLDKYSLCTTLEDVIREVPGQPVETWKVKAETAIPAGRYEIVLSYSNHFQRMMPFLKDVPGFTGIMIHIGNRPVDTDGCILVGEKVNDPEFITHSKIQFDKLYSLIESTIKRGDKVFITIRNPSV